MASVDKALELNNGSQEVENSPLTTEPSASNEALASTDSVSGGSSGAETPSAQKSASRLAPAPIPESNPWKRESRPDQAVRVTPEAFAPRSDHTPPQASKKTTGKEKWMPYTPVVNANSQQPRRDRSKRKQRAQKSPEAEHKDKDTKSPTSGGSGSGSGPANPVNGNGEKKEFKQRQPRKKYTQQQPQVQTPYDMTLSLLVQQFDYYFSIENLCKDIYLRKQMNSQGFIPVQILADFNRVRILSNGNVNVVREACNWCPATEVVGERVRLATGWDKWILPIEDRDEPGKAESDSEEETPKFQIDKAVPFVPKRTQ